jgi:signal transduction histidine kinase
MIWEHFERGAHRLDSTTPGLGIGLSIVQAVAESHGGRADYRKSERLGGACFALTIPGCVVLDEPARAKIPANS